MKKSLSAFILFFVSFPVFISFTNPENEKPVSDFRLMNVDGKMMSLYDYPEAKGFIIVFTCNHCPFAKLYPSRLNQLYAKYLYLGVPLIAISSTDTILYEDDTYLKMIDRANEEEYHFPYLFDGMQEVAKNFGAQKTPHAFVVWKEENVWVTKYSGAIDDNGAEPELVKNQYVEQAVNSLLAGETVLIKKTNSIGCEIKIRK